jgi:sec-independent protein translocase protein TatA
MPFNLGGPEVLVILVIVLIVFGAGRLPNVMKDIGSGMREFKRAQTEPDDRPTTTPLAGTAGAASAPTTAPASSASPAEPAPRA